MGDTETTLSNLSHFGEVVGRSASASSHAAEITIRFCTAQWEELLDAPTPLLEDAVLLGIHETGPC